MNIQIIKSKYPKAYNELTSWILAFTRRQIPNITDEALKKAPIDNVIGLMLSNNQGVRSLYDFLDGYQIHMFVMGSIEWQYKIVDPANHNNSTNEEMYKTRSLAEDAGFIASFAELEKKLS